MPWPLLVIALLFLASCATEVPEADHQADWRQVLEHKKAAAAIDASAVQKQAYADALAEFVRRYPEHSRAREVYHRVQLEFADELASLGRYQDAIRFYSAGLTHDSTKDDAQQRMAKATERMAIGHDKLEQLEQGMSRREVAVLLGRPSPGWTTERERRGVTFEAWYYRTTTGGIAGVYFREGKVFAAEANSNATLGL